MLRVTPVLFPKIFLLGVLLVPSQIIIIIIIKILKNNGNLF